MRKPKVHIGFNADNAKGMSTLLINKTSLEETINHSSLKNLDFITAGPLPPNPSELIISDEFDKLIEQLKQKYDYVVIDNPPVGLVTDGISCIKKADYPIYVFRAGYSKRGFVHHADKLFIEKNIHKLSYVVNRVDLAKSNYGYGYGYGYGYYSDEEEREKSKLKKIFNK
jgi:capsular exopolysaccharide synthesis family protein